MKNDLLFELNGPNRSEISALQNYDISGPNHFLTDRGNWNNTRDLKDLMREWGYHSKFGFI